MATILLTELGELARKQRDHVLPFEGICDPRDGWSLFLQSCAAY
jgi:hypothetical protein